MKKVSFCVAMLGSIVLLVGSASAQDYRARVQGSVVDESQGALPGVTVTLANDATGVDVTRVTDADGRYVFDFVDPGTYSIAAELQGFKKAEQKNVRVQQRGSVTANLTLGGMNAFIVTQQGPGQPGWGLQYTLDLRPAAARTYEPKALTTHTTARNIEQLIKFYRLTGETKFLARIPEALDWLDAVKRPPELATSTRTHPTFIELDTNKPLYVHRHGSNVVNGQYTADYDPRKTIGHYSAFRRLDVAGLRQLYQQVKSLPAAEATKASPLLPGAGIVELPRFFASPRPPGPGETGAMSERAARVISGLNERGYWPTKLVTTSHPYRSGPSTTSPGDFSQTLAGDEFDTSPYNDDTLVGISTTGYIENMSLLVRYLEERR